MHLMLHGRDGDGVEQKKSKVWWRSFQKNECMNMVPCCMFVYEGNFLHLKK